MEEIAQEADVGKGTVYEYFSSKEQLFFEMLQMGKNFYHDSLTKEVNSEVSLQNKLKKIAYLHLKFIQEYKDFGRVMMQEFLQLGSEMQNYFWKAHEQEITLLSQTFQDGMSQGILRPLDCKVVAQIFHGAVHSMGGPMIFLDEEPDLEQLSTTIIEVFFKGIAK